MTARRGRPGGADLPPAWDGVAVAWSQWADAPRTSWDFHAPVDERACDRCGLVDGRTRYAAGRVEGAIRFYVRRCECGHDVVHDESTGESWDLDPSDYGPDGSYVDGARPAPSPSPRTGRPCRCGATAARLYPGGWLCDEHRPTPPPPVPPAGTTLADLRARRAAEIHPTTGARA